MRRDDHYLWIGNLKIRSVDAGAGGLLLVFLGLHGKNLISYKKVACSGGDGPAASEALLRRKYLQDLSLFELF